MGSAKLFTMAAILLAWETASYAGGSTQEVEWSTVIENLRAIDGRVLQLALRTKCGDEEHVQAERETLVFLAGIDKVFVSIADPLEEYGLTEDVVKTTIELRLRRNGVKLYDAPADPNEYREFMLKHPASMFRMFGLSLCIDTISLDEGNVTAAHLTLSQSQFVNLLSAYEPTFIMATTWRAGSQVIGGPESVARRCRETIDDLVDKYCNDWLAAHGDKETHKPGNGARGPSRSGNDER